jgi:hypothetical protein
MPKGAGTSAIKTAVGPERRAVQNANFLQDFNPGLQCAIGILEPDGTKTGCVAPLNHWQRSAAKLEQEKS